jgi:hypothetical protein
MSIQTQCYIEDMKKMYEIVSKKDKLNFNELEFLEIYKRTIRDV